MLENAALWLEKAAKHWISQNYQRVPVTVKPAVGWKGSGTLLADASQNRAIQMQMDFTDQIQTHTIQFNGFDSNLDIGPAPLFAPMPEAEILWQVKGVTIRRLVSVIDGMSVSGAAQSVAVNIRDNTVGGNGAEYKIGMTVAPGVRPSTEMPPWLRVTGTDNAGAEWPMGASILAAGFIDWIVPADAGVMSTFFTVKIVAGTVVDNVEIAFFGSNGATLRRCSADIRNLWVPIPQGTNRIRLTNGTANTINVSLTLGIDG